jgi:hypothetical protein
MAAQSKTFSANGGDNLTDISPCFILNLFEGLIEVRAKPFTNVD